MFDVHELVMLDGKRYLMNMFGWEGAILDGKAQGVYSFAGINDVVAAMTQQSQEIITEICDIKERSPRVNFGQVERVWQNWIEQDVNIKIAKVETFENPEKKFRNDYEEFQLSMQNVFMVQADSTLGQIKSVGAKLCQLQGETFSERYKTLGDEIKMLLELPEEEVKPQIGIYSEKGFERYKAWLEKDDQPDNQPALYRYIFFMWILKRRAGLI
jgi:hypothetical protein